MDRNNVRSAYLTHLFDLDARELTIARMYQCIQKSNLKFDAIAFRGWSGGLLVPDLATRLGVGFIGVRKDFAKEPAHGYEVEGYTRQPDIRYIIVDDFIGCGTTIKAIVSEIARDGRRLADEKEREHNFAIEQGWEIVPKLFKITRSCVGIFLHREVPSATQPKEHGLYTIEERTFGDDESTLTTYACGVYGLI